MGGKRWRRVRCGCILLCCRITHWCALVVQTPFIISSDLRLTDIDFVYTEDLAIEEPRDGHEAEELLENLLELLSLADQWNLESLKQKVGVSVHQYKLISPDTLPRSEYILSSLLQLL